MCGEVKTKIRNLIASEYGFLPSQSSKACKHNLKWAAVLKDDLNFTYKVTFILVRCLHPLTTSTEIEILQAQQSGRRTKGFVSSFSYTEGCQRCLVCTLP